VALLIALLLGHYPGERLILAVAKRVHCRPRRDVRTAPRRAPLDSTRIPRGGDLLARALAGRAPSRTWPTQCPSVN
jgi:hypothetical protein